MTWIGRCLLVLSTVVVMIGFMPTLTGRWPAPNLILAVVVVLSLMHDLRQSLLWAALGGGLLDLAELGHGWSMVALISLALSLMYLTSRLIERPPVYLLIIIVVASAASLPLLELMMQQLPAGWLERLAGATCENLGLIAFVYLSIASRDNAHQRGLLAVR